VTRGPAGYGRYDDDPEHVGCPWAKSDMTPCVARDGAICLSGTPTSLRARSPAHVCVGCGHTPRYLLADLAEVYDPARQYLETADPQDIAARLAEMVRAATAPLVQQ
jgi:hypothetical protein